MKYFLDSVEVTPERLAEEAERLENLNAERPYDSAILFDTVIGDRMFFYIHTFYEE